MFWMADGLYSTETRLWLIIYFAALNLEACFFSVFVWYYVTYSRLVLSEVKLEYRSKQTIKSVNNGGYDLRL